MASRLRSAVSPWSRTRKRSAERALSSGFSHSCFSQAFHSSSVRCGTSVNGTGDGLPASSPGRMREGFVLAACRGGAETEVAQGGVCHRPVPPVVGLVLGPAVR